MARSGWPLRSLWRAYVASFVFNLGSTNDLIRMLRRARAGRRLCGFGDRLPHRTTFNRFISRLALHPDLVEQSIASATSQLRGLLPDLGDEVAVDSTVVRTYANPNRQTLSRPPGQLDGQEQHEGEGRREGVALRVQTPHSCGRQPRHPAGDGGPHQEYQELSQQAKSP